MGLHEVLVPAGRMKLKVHRVERKIHVHRVINGKSNSVATLHLDLIFGDRYVEFLDFLEHFVPDIVLGFRAVGGKLGLILQEVLEIVVRVKGGASLYRTNSTTTITATPK